MEIELEKFKVLRGCQLKNKGVYLEVDLEYPVEFNAGHRNLRLAPGRFNVCYTELSPINKFFCRK